MILNDLPQLLSATEAARRLGVTKARFYELVRRGMVPAVRIGRQIRVDSAALEAWISAGGRPLEGVWRHTSDA